MVKELNFLELIQTHRRGELLHECDELLTELIAAVERTGSKGVLTIKLPFAYNKAGQIEMTPSVELKKPRRALGAGIFYGTDDGALSRRDPKQDDMFDEDVVGLRPGAKESH